LTLELAVRITEIILGVALLQQSLEFLRGLQPEKILGAVRVLLAILLIAGLQTFWVETALLAIGILLLRRFQGPYNGGSDAMTLLVLLCLWLAQLAPNRFWQEMALGYLAFQLIWSYFQSGYIKIINPDWRSGRALCDVFAFTAYPVADHLRSLAQSSRLLWVMSWVVILFEILFPLALLNKTALLLALGVAGLFHLANAWLFGLNRFLWIWPAAYPILFWLQGRLLLSL
jgi:hypothetical protein